MLDGIAKVTERRKMAADIITSVTQRLRSGWNPWAELSNSRQYAKVDDVINIYVKYLKKLHTAGSIKDSTLVDYNKRLRVLCDYMQTTHYLLCISINSICPTSVISWTTSYSTVIQAPGLETITNMAIIILLLVG